MRANYIQLNSPQFRLLSDEQIEELHFATLEILERTGVAFESQEAINLLSEAGADTYDTNRVKIPSYLVEKALSTTTKTISIYTRDGQLAMVLNVARGSHFLGVADCPEYLDPYTRRRRKCYVEDIAENARVVDALPNIEGAVTGGAHPTVPGTISDKVSLLQFIRNSSKPITCSINDTASLREMIEVCTTVSGGEEQFRRKPFVIGISEPITPLTQGKDAMETSLLCAEKGIPNIVYGMQMAGATAPATWPAVLIIANAEFLSQLVVIQLKHPGAPVIYGAIPAIMDMKTAIACTGAPELALMAAALTELCHYYKLPMFGTAGWTDANKIGAQAAAEVTYHMLMSALSGANLVHTAGQMYRPGIVSPEMIVFCNEIIDMVKVSMRGIEINDETLALDLIERVGPRGAYISEQHTLEHFRQFWDPPLFDRKIVEGEGAKTCEDLLNERTIKIIETHQPKLLPDDVLKELKKIETAWLKRVGLEEYPKRNKQ